MKTGTKLATVEHEIRADEVKPGDYLAGLGRVQSYNQHKDRVTLFSEWNLWRVSVNRQHRVIVLRTAGKRA